MPPGCLVRLVHPVLLDAAGLERLRSLAAKLRIEQPVRQLWRETFRIYGRIAAATILGHDTADVASHGIVPRVTFTDPQVCTVGKTLAEAQASGLKVTAVSTTTGGFPALISWATASAAPASL